MTSYGLDGDSEQCLNRLQLDLILVVNFVCELGQIITRYDLLGARRVTPTCLGRLKGKKMYDAHVQCFCNILPPPPETKRFRHACAHNLPPVLFDEHWKRKDMFYDVALEG